MKPQPFLSALAISLLAGCGINPARPIPSPVQQPLPLPNSHISAAISVDLSGALALANREIPSSFSAGWPNDWIEDPPGNRAKYRYNASREPLQFSLVRGDLKVVASGKYQACGAYDLPLAPIIVVCCGTSPPGDGPRGMRSQITLRARPSADWRIAVSPSIDEVKGTDACNLSAARIPATSLVEGRVRAALEANLSKLSTRLSEVDFRSQAQPLWEAAQQPIPLAANTWLVLNPSRVSIGPLSGDGAVVTVRAALAAQPVVVVGARPTAMVRPLPAQLDTAGAAEEFSVVLEGRLSGPAADRQVQGLLVGRRVVQGDKYIQITDAHLYGSGGNAVALEVAFSGSAKGTIYFVGTPQLNTGTGELAVPDLDFDVETKNTLLKAADWLLHPTVREFFAARAKLQLAPVLEQGRQEANRSIANGSAGKVRWQGELRTLQASSVLVTPTEIVARVVATGALAVSVVP